MTKRRKYISKGDNVIALDDYEFNEFMGETVYNEGDKGKVLFIDEYGDPHVKFENGEVYAVDKKDFEVVKE